MFRAYTVDLNDIDTLIKYETATSIYDDVKVSKIKGTLKSILASGKEFLNAEELCNLFFPTAECPIFLSHSGHDKEKVRKFAQWLKKYFDINAFIDSDLWGCIRDLQSEIDEEYCCDEGQLIYEKVKYTTAHVHMMLCHALTQMIYRAECFIFLKSTASISIQDAQTGTFSPWIFHELATVDTIARRRSRTTLPKDESVQENYSKKEIKVFYPIPYKRLVTLTLGDLERWQSAFENPYGDELKRVLEYAGMLCVNHDTENAPSKKWEKALNWIYTNC